MKYDSMAGNDKMTTYNINGIYDNDDLTIGDVRVTTTNELVRNERKVYNVYKKDFDQSRDVVLFKPNKIILYRPVIGVRKHKAEQIIKQINENKRKRNGEMSRATTNRCQQILYTWLLGLHFIPVYYEVNKKSYRRCATAFTLTLSSKQKHTDKWIKKYMLERFMIMMQRRFNVSKYFWRAETQLNGNIHFHVIVDAFIHKKMLQTKWNELQYELGYLDSYKSIHGHTNAPSTQIQSAGTVGCISYITKYLSKDEVGRRIIDGALWGCSYDLKDQLSLSVDWDDRIMKEICKLIAKDKDCIYSEKHFDVINCKDVLSFICRIDRVKQEIMQICRINQNMLYKFVPIDEEYEYHDVNEIENILNNIQLSINF